MPIDTFQFQAPQDAQDTKVDHATAPGHYERPDFELRQQQPLMERDFTQAAMHPETRRAAEEAWDLQERQKLDLEMFDQMNDEETTARSQVAEVHHESDTQVVGVTEEMVRGWTEQFMLSRDAEVSRALVRLGRNGALNN